mmetsp:Transcript_40348/g.91396  ORF Transcript_40348/g.91396 Transcript_40348/m.91396 type:complete len:292 (-) Transcript_40348:736-1611(-)
MVLYCGPSALPRQGLAAVATLPATDIDLHPSPPLPQCSTLPCFYTLSRCPPCGLASWRRALRSAQPPTAVSCGATMRGPPLGRCSALSAYSLSPTRWGTRALRLSAACYMTTVDCDPVLHSLSRWAAWAPLPLLPWGCFMRHCSGGGGAKLTRRKHSHQRVRRRRGHILSRPQPLRLRVLGHRLLRPFSSWARCSPISACTAWSGACTRSTSGWNTAGLARGAASHRWWVTYSAPRYSASRPWNAPRRPWEAVNCQAACERCYVLHTVWRCSAVARPRSWSCWLSGRSLSR